MTYTECAPSVPSPVALQQQRRATPRAPRCYSYSAVHELCTGNEMNIKKPFDWCREFTMGKHEGVVIHSVLCGDPALLSCVRIRIGV